MKKSLLRAFAAGICILGTVGIAGADSITLTGTIRDFNASHPDFEYKIAIEEGIVQTTLGVDGKPVYAGGAGTTTTTGAANFNQWYNDTPDVNMSQAYSIILDKVGTKYTYSDLSFFPIDDQLFGNEGRVHNYHFTYELHSQFTYTGSEQFKFTGDDDVWVFINDKLVIDLGGVHPSQTGSVELSSLSLTAGLNYSFDLFFAERHTTESRFGMETSIVFNPNPVPEPATMLLFGAGLVGLAGLRLRKKK